MSDFAPTLKIPARAEFWFFFPYRVRYAEADRRGHLFNAHYLTYFGTAMVEYFRALPFDLRAAEKAEEVAIHVVRSIVEPATPIRFDDNIDVGVRTARLGRSSITFAFGAFRNGTELAAAAGEMVWVYTSRAAHKSTPWPATLRKIIRAREGANLVEA